MIECNLPAKSFEFFARKRQQWSIKVREGIGLFEQKQMPLGRKSMWGKKIKKIVSATAAAIDHSMQIVSGMVTSVVKSSYLAQASTSFLCTH